MKKNHPSLYSLMHVIIGIIIAFIFYNITPPAPLTHYGLTVIGLFVVTNYWFMTLSMIWPSALALVLYVLMTATPAGNAVSAIFGTTTVWQVIMLMPICGALKETGATDVIAKWLISRKVLSGRPMLFSYFFLFACFMVGLLTGTTSAVILSFVLFEGVAENIGYKPGDRYYSGMMVATFVSSALGTTVIPYRSYLTGMINSFSKVMGYPLNGAYYILYALIFMLIFMALMLLAMRYILRVDMTLLKGLDTQTLVKDGVGKINLQGKILLGVIGVVILGILYPLVIKSGWLFELLNNKLTNSLFFALAVVAVGIIHVDKKPLVDMSKAISKYVPWVLIFSMGIMLFFADCLSSEDAGVKDFLSVTMGAAFQGMSSVPFIICTVALTVIVTGFFSNMATGIIMVSATMPLAATFGMNETVLGILILFSSMFGFLSPGGNGMTPLLYGNENLDSKKIYQYILPFCLIFMVMNVVLGLVMNAVF